MIEPVNLSPESVNYKTTKHINTDQRTEEFPKAISQLLPKLNFMYIIISCSLKIWMRSLNPDDQPYNLIDFIF